MFYAYLYPYFWCYIYRYALSLWNIIVGKYRFNQNIEILLHMRQISLWSSWIHSKLLSESSASNSAKQITFAQLSCRMGFNIVYFVKIREVWLLHNLKSCLFFWKSRLGKEGAYIVKLPSNTFKLQRLKSRLFWKGIRHSLGISIWWPKYTHSACG